MASRNRLRPEWAPVRTNLREAARWLASEQPHADRAVGDHLGHGAHIAPGLYMSVAPNGWHGHRGDGAVIVFNIRWPETDPDGNHIPPETLPPLEPFSAEDVKALRAEIETAGMAVEDHWNGVGPKGARYATVSYGIADQSVHPSQHKAIRNYNDGCPVHGHVFCGQESISDDETGCTWWIDRRALWDTPNLVAVAPPTPQSGAAQESGDDDKNLEAVKRTLVRITPILTEHGVHAGTLAAGLRGHIDGTTGNLTFVPDQGHGVLIPAELAELLVNAYVDLEDLRTQLD